MKKIVGTIAAIALAASSAFAGVNVGMGFSRGFFTPFAYDGKDARMDISTSWGAEPRIGASISAASDDCGVVADIKFDGGNVAVNDNAYIWCKPASWLKFTIGQTFDDTLRGNACFGSWDWLRFGEASVPGSKATGYHVNPETGAIEPTTPAGNPTWKGNSILTGEDFIFTRICGNPLSGAYAPVVGTIVMLDPIEGLHVAAAFNIVNYNSQKYTEVFSRMQVQAGYTIANIGTIKAQWIGAGEGKDAFADWTGDRKEKKNQIEAAFDLTAVENMTLSVGAKFRTYKDAPVDVAAYWTMGFDALRLHASVGATFSKVLDETRTGLVAGVGADYDFGNGLGLSADFRFANVFMKDVDSDPSIGFGVYLNKGIANGGLGIGVEGAVRAQIRDFAPSNPKDDFTVAVPVRVQCFF